VCEAECESLPLPSGNEQSSGTALGQISAWEELNKLKLK